MYNCDNKNKTFCSQGFVALDYFVCVFIYLNFRWLALLLCTELTNIHWLLPLTIVLCGVLTIDHVTSSVTAVFPLAGQHCGTICLNSFGNRTSSSDNSNDR